MRHRPPSAPLSPAAWPPLLLLTASLAGCGYGPIAPPPCVRNPGTASAVTVRRVPTLVGAPATMFLVVENERVYGLAMGQQVSFELDAGEHRIGYDLGFNQCRARVLLEPGSSYLIELLPVCDIQPQDLSKTCPTPRTWPAT